MWFGWTHCLAHQVSLMSVQQFWYLLHQMCWKPALSQFQLEALVQLSLSPSLCGRAVAPLTQGSSSWILSLCELGDVLAFPHWIALKEKGCLSEGLETSGCGLGQWQCVWGGSLSALTHCIRTPGSRSCWMVGSTCREVGLSSWGLALSSTKEILRPSQLLY